MILENKFGEIFQFCIQDSIKVVRRIIITDISLHFHFVNTEPTRITLI